MQQSGIGFPSVKPIGYPNASYPRIEVTEDVLHVDRRLKAGKGALGTIVGADSDVYTILFDEGQACHIEADGGGRLIQRVPYHAFRRL